MQNRWAYEPIISHSEMIIFHNAMCQHKDIYYYHPIAVAKCFEIGTKYRFLCIAKTKSIPSIPSHFANIEIYQSERGMPYATRLAQTPFDGIFQ